MTKSISHLNHYVPVWYQKGFLVPDEHSFHYLDLNPEEIRRPDGGIVKLKHVRILGPLKCFRQDNLYTINIFGTPNDDIERHLFGAIDHRGATAITALIDDDQRTLHNFFWSALEYLDAQKLRTPKGLAWIKYRFNTPSQNRLMVDMQRLREMHITMWAEAVLEIVSADQADTKFLLTDHPVTVYNAACFPASRYCASPNEPSTAWIGTQTIFPLNLEKCLIITNLEYAKSTNRTELSLRKPRTNARYFASTMTRHDRTIRSRHLSDIDVACINFILKNRAHRFIAACNKDWLYPEKVVKTRWDKIGNVLLPPRQGLWNYGGEIYIAGKYGELLWYQDEHGRNIEDASSFRRKTQEMHRMRSQVEELLAKEKAKKPDEQK